MPKGKQGFPEDGNVNIVINGIEFPRKACKAFWKKQRDEICQIIEKHGALNTRQVMELISWEESFIVMQKRLARLTLAGNIIKVSAINVPNRTPTHKAGRPVCLFCSHKWYEEHFPQKTE